MLHVGSYAMVRYGLWRHTAQTQSSAHWCVHNSWQTDGSRKTYVHYVPRLGKTALDSHVTAQRVHRDDLSDIDTGWDQSPKNTRRPPTRRGRVIDDPSNLCNVPTIRF